MNAVLWPYRFLDMKDSWAPGIRQLVRGLQANKIKVKLHSNFICKGLKSGTYRPAKDNPTDICIYNHAMLSDLTGNCLQAQHNWFWKPTGPTPHHAAIDSLGYGPSLSICYDEPDFRGFHTKGFKDTVGSWISDRVCKWGDRLSELQEPHCDDYWLILGQCSGDSVVTRMDWGGYVNKLLAVVRELCRVDESGRRIIIKLHPYMAGRDLSMPEHVTETAGALMEIDTRVQVITGMCSVHPYIKHCKAVLLANSGSGLEVMMHGKPIICWGHPEYHWTSYDLRHLCDLVRAIKLDWFKPDLQWQWLDWFCNHFCITTDEGAARRVKELLEK